MPPRLADKRNRAMYGGWMERRGGWKERRGGKKKNKSVGRPGALD